MKCNTNIIRKGYDGKKCLVHARCCFTPDFALATAQYLDVDGSDLFEGIQCSLSHDGGKSWSEFKPQKGLLPVKKGKFTYVGCDGTPMYHKKTGKVILLGHTAGYEEGMLHPTGKQRSTFYSVFDEKTGEFTESRFVDMPGNITNSGNGSGQSFELDNGDLLIPIHYKKENEENSYSAVMKCSFDGEEIKLLEMGNSFTVPVERGLCEPSVIFHKGVYYVTYRNDECAFVSKSLDGLHYTDLQLWRWSDGSLLDSYNTQQHWMVLGDELYLVYTRRGANNDHVFRHRAPLFAARVENMRLVRESEMPVVPERGARLGNFCVTQISDRKAAVMAAEWMQPKGCERFGSENAIFLSVVENEN